MITIHQPIEGIAERNLRAVRKKYLNLGLKISNREIIALGVQAAQQKIAIAEVKKDAELAQA